MSVSVLRRFLVPPIFTTLVCWTRFGAKVSHRAEVELNSNLKLGAGVVIGSFTKLKCAGVLELGENVDIANSCFIAAHEGGIRIGRDTLIGPNVSILSANLEIGDIDVPIRHLHATRSIVTLTDKTFRLYNHNRQRTLDALEMTRIVHGLGRDAFEKTPCVFASINPNSPREYDASMLWGMIECALAGQALMISPFILAGAMAPSSLAGALAQQNAEALAGIAFCQMVRAGTPVTYGGFVSNADMKSGAPAFGTPEHVKTTLVIGQMARHYGLPYRAANANASNAVDAQAAYESQMCLWACLVSGATYVYHGLGWLEGGLSASIEKFIVDAEMIQGLVEAIRPIDFSPEELAVDAIGEIPPGGHFFGSAHTIERYEHAFYHPMLSDWRNFESWSEAGAPDAAQRAAQIADNLLKAYEAPPLDDSIALELDEFIAKREAEGGAPLQ